MSPKSPSRTATDCNSLDSSLILSPDGGRIASGFAVWDLASERLVGQSRHRPRPDIAVFAADGLSMFGVEKKGAASILHWNLTTDQQTRPFDEAIRAAGASGFNYLAISPTGKTLATAGMDRSIRIWHIPTGTMVARLKAAPAVQRRMGFHPDAAQEVRFVEFSPDGRRLVSTCWDDNLQVWYLVALIGNQSSCQLFLSVDRRL